MTSINPVTLNNECKGTLIKTFIAHAEGIPVAPVKSAPGEPAQCAPKVGAFMHDAQKSGLPIKTGATTYEDGRGITTELTFVARPK